MLAATRRRSCKDGQCNKKQKRAQDSLLIPQVQFHHFLERSAQEKSSFLLPCQSYGSHLAEETDFLQRSATEAEIFRRVFRNIRRMLFNLTRGSPTRRAFLGIAGDEMTSNGVAARRTLPGVDDHKAQKRARPV